MSPPRLKGRSLTRIFAAALPGRFALDSHGTSPWAEYRFAPDALQQVDLALDTAWARLIAGTVAVLSGLPTVWDETVVVLAEVVRNVVITRRPGQRWALAAINGDTPVPLRVSLSFLKTAHWTLRQFADTSTSTSEPELMAKRTREVVSSDVVGFSLPATGVFAVMLTTQSPAPI